MEALSRPLLSYMGSRLLACQGEPNDQRTSQESSPSNRYLEIGASLWGGPSDSPRSLETPQQRPTAAQLRANDQSQTPAAGARAQRHQVRSCSRPRHKAALGQTAESAQTTPAITPSASPATLEHALVQSQHSKKVTIALASEGCATPHQARGPEEAPSTTHWQARDARWNTSHSSPGWGPGRH